ncbi:MAG TPA: hypothetical protein VGR89_12785 [Puia sp.]|nr:hypothetical protein [Puia sp.]
MKNLPGLLALTALCSLSACKGHEKAIMIYADSDIKIDDTQKHITVSDGTTHHEQELEFHSSSPVTLTVGSPQGKFDFTATDDGLYVLNLKTDTVVGSYKHVGENAVTHISQEVAKHDLDSLQKLVADQNVSDANRNYFIVPDKMVRISANPKGKIFGPFQSIPGSFDAGSVPEIYKFYNISEVRDIIDNLEKVTK